MVQKELPIVILAGPTASGKSALAMDIAKTLDAVIINCDSKQIYTEIPIITAQPSNEEQQEVEHMLYGHVSAAVHVHVDDWCHMAKDAVEFVLSQKRIPLLVGGTGMYIKAFIEGIAPIPDIPSSIREETRKTHKQHDNQYLLDTIQTHDPKEAAKLHPSDTQRILRSFEVIQATGKSLHMWQQQPHKTFFDRKRFLSFFLSPDKDLNYQHCNQRFETMIDQGLIHEMEQLHSMNLDPALPAMKAHGVPEMMAYLDGTMSLDDAITQSQLNTRHYIKRQGTWFRGQMKDATLLTPPAKNDMLALIEKRLKHL